MIDNDLANTKNHVMISLFVDNSKECSAIAGVQSPLYLIIELI